MKQKNKSAVHEAATLMTNEGGKSNAKRADFLQGNSILINQHARSSRTNPSILLRLLKEARVLRKKLKKKK